MTCLTEIVLTVLIYLIEIVLAVAVLSASGGQVPGGCGVASSGSSSVGSDGGITANAGTNDLCTLPHHTTTTCIPVQEADGLPDVPEPEKRAPMFVRPLPPPLATKHDDATSSAAGGKIPTSIYNICHHLQYQCIPYYFNSNQLF
jgi:hypothetical protein